VSPRDWSPRSLVGPALAAAVLVILLGCILTFPGYLVDRDLGASETLVPAQRLKAVNDVRTTLLQGLAGLFFLVTAFYTGRQLKISRQQLRVSEDQQIAERFTRAVDQLGSKTRDVRIGGIYALEGIGRDRVRDFEVIAEILAAVVRERVPLVDRSVASAKTKPDADVQAALTVLGRRSGGYARRLDLSQTDLTGADLSQADLRGANLRGARLDNAVLNGARLMNADLSKAQLNGARLVGADLHKARLEDAELRRSRLVDARLDGAKAARADMREALLTNSSVTGARLIKVRLEGAKLKGVNLSEARHGDLTYDKQTVWPTGFEPPIGDEPAPSVAHPPS